MIKDLNGRNAQVVMDALREKGLALLADDRAYDDRTLFDVAGLCFAAERAISVLTSQVTQLERFAANASPDESVPERPARVATGAKHRHKFAAMNADGVERCAICLKPKSANGRKPAAAPDAPPVDARTRTLPLVGDVAADRFADGGQGSSGVVRR